MPALLFTVALAAGQPSVQTVRAVDPGASARASVVQDLSAIVSGSPPFVASVQGPHPAPDASVITLRQSGAGVVSTSVNTGVNSVTLAATAVAARVVLP
ncbi:MAG: hypothetical protein ACXU82_08995 [Caulobacteraceae bacterium]